MMSNFDDDIDDLVEEELEKHGEGHKVLIEDNASHWPFSKVTDKGVLHLACSFLLSVFFICVTIYLIVQMVVQAW